MKLFVDASALVAMLALEEDFERLADRLDRSDCRLTSPLARWEAATGLCRSHGYDPAVAFDELGAFAEARDIGTVPIGEREAMIAFDAYHRYGKGRHPARLNMGDCFAYACARTNDAALLYKGDDFALTDLA